MSSQVVLSFGYRLRLLVSLDTAVKMFELLANDHIMLVENTYRNSKSVPTIAPWGTEEIKIEYISPADIMIRTATAEAIAAENVV